jgi:hypothetical protein
MVMPSPQINFSALDKSQVVVAKLHSIDPSLQLGSNMTVNSLMTLIEDTRTAINAYNTTVATMAETYRTIRSQERTIVQLTAQMQFGVAYKYGKDSHEYQLVKGDKKLRRRRSPSIDPPAPMPATHSQN